MDIQKILDYQKKDFEIIKLQRQLLESTDRIALNTISAIVKKSQASSAGLEKESEDAIKTFTNLKQTYDSLMAENKKLSSKNLEKLKEEDGVELMSKVNSISQNLTVIEKKLLILADKINTIISQYEATKKEYNLAGQKHKIHKENYQKLSDKITPEIEKLSKELKALSKDIDANFLEKYKSKRQDKVFPVFVPMVNNACGGCMMELPSGLIEKLNKNGFLECENCHRIIYKI